MAEEGAEEAEEKVRFYLKKMQNRQLVDTLFINYLT